MVKAPNPPLSFLGIFKAYLFRHALSIFRDINSADDPAIGLDLEAMVTLAVLVIAEYALNLIFFHCQILQCALSSPALLRPGRQLKCE